MYLAIVESYRKNVNFSSCRVREQKSNSHGHAELGAVKLKKIGMLRPATVLFYLLCSCGKWKEKTHSFFLFSFLFTASRMPKKITITFRRLQVSSFDWQQKEARVLFLPWMLWEPEPLDQQRPLVPVHCLRKFWRIWVSLSWFLNLLTIDWLMILSCIWWCLTGAHPTTTSPQKLEKYWKSLPVGKTLELPSWETPNCSTQLIR